MNKFFVLLVFTTLVACTTVRLPQADSREGRAYVNRCGQCHAAPHPARLRKHQWPPMVALMETRIRERGLAPMDGSERQAILDYLARHAR